jgi:hypothetical protein
LYIACNDSDSILVSGGQSAPGLRDFLSDGPKPSEGGDGVFAAGDAAGHKRDTLYKAKNLLGVKARKANGGFVWLLPETNLNTRSTEEPEVPEVKTLI